MKNSDILFARDKLTPVLIILTAVIVFLPPQIIVAQNCKDFFSGQWDTDWGEMTLLQTGCTIKGTYEYEDGKITGVVTKDGMVLEGEWSESPSYQPPDDKGIIRLELSPNRNIFSGYWCYGNSDSCGSWEGSLVRKHAEDEPPTSSSKPPMFVSSRETTTYRDPSQGFSISYPKNWQQMPKKYWAEGINVAFWLQESEVLQYFTVGKARLASQVSLENFFKEAKRHLETVEGCKSISTEDTIIDGLPAIEYIYTFEESGVAFKAIQIFLMKGQIAWSVTSVTEIKYFDSLKPTFDDIVNSLEVPTGEETHSTLTEGWAKMPWPSLDSNEPVNLRGVWGSSGSDVFAVGDHGVILHYDGNSWTAMDHPGPDWILNDVWGTAWNDVYAVGDLGLILHYNGDKWTLMENNPFYDSWMPPDFLTISGTSMNFFVGDDEGTVWRYRNAEWIELGGEGTGSSDCGLSKIVDLSLTPGGDLFAITDVPFAGFNFAACYFDGQKWAPLEELTYHRFSAGWLSNSYNIWVAGESADPETWYGTGEFAMFHFNGKNWNKVSTPSLEPGEWVKSIWGSSYGNVFAAGDGGPLWRFDGSKWTKVNNPHQMYAVYDIWGSSGGDVFFVGTGPFILHYGKS